MARLFFFLVILPFFVNSQTNVDAERFFAEGLNLIGPTPNDTLPQARFAWIEEYQIRTQTNEFDVDRQEYDFRFRPVSPNKRKAQLALYDHISNAPNFAWEEAYCDRIQDLYRDWTELYFIQERFLLIDRWTEILQDKQTVYARMLGAYNFDPRELLDLQADQTDLAVERQALRQKRNYLLKSYGLETDSLVFFDFISVGEILTKLSTVNPITTVEPDGETQYERELVIREMALEKAEAKQALDFLQIEYQGPHSDAWKERISLGLALEISNSGSRKIKQQELLIEQKELDREITRQMVEDTDKLSRLQQKLFADIESYRFFEQALTNERERLASLGADWARQEGSNPLFLLDIEQRHLENLEEALDQRREILSDYSDWLEQSGWLCREPFVNYLSK